MSPTGKRKTLDRFSHLLAVSTLPGAELAIEYLYSKYIRNLSIHTIRQTGRVVFSFLQFLRDAIASVRDRALILLLLRTGMRIGELLEVQINDIVMSDRKILIYLGSKNYQGRAVYFSEDAEHALKHWLCIRDSKNDISFTDQRWSSSAILLPGV